MSCYEQFGWTSDDIPRLPYSEAQYLSIYFEELSAHNHRQAKEAERNARSDESESPGIHKEVVLRLSDDDEEDEDE